MNTETKQEPKPDAPADESAFPYCFDCQCRITIGECRHGINATKGEWWNANNRARRQQAAKLAAKVAGENQVNDLANQYELELRKYFGKLIGRKVTTQSGHVWARIKELMPEKPAGLLRLWQSGSTYRLCFECDVTTQAGEHSCVYSKAWIDIGELSDTRLVKLHELPTNRRTDYTVEEVIANRRDYQQKRDAKDAAYSKLSPFGEHDNF